MVSAAHTGSSSRRTALVNRAPWSSFAWQPCSPGRGPQAEKQVRHRQPTAFSLLNRPHSISPCFRLRPAKAKQSAPKCFRPVLLVQPLPFVVAYVPHAPFASAFLLCACMLVAATHLVLIRHLLALLCLTRRWFGRPAGAAQLCVRSHAFIPMPLPWLAWAAWEYPCTPQIAHGSVATARRYASERTGAAFGMGAAAVVPNPIAAALGTTEFIARRALSMRRCSRSCSDSGVVGEAARRKGVRRIM